MLISLSEAKSFINIDLSDTDFDSILNSFIEAAGAVIDNYCQTSIEQTTFEYDFKGNFKTDILLPFNNVTNAINLKKASKRTDSYELIDGDSYELFDISGVYHLYYENRFTDYYKVTLTAGYTTIPDDIKHVAKHIVAYFFRESGQRQGQFGNLTGIDTLSITNREGLTTNFKFKSMFADFHNYLNKYKVIYV